MQSVTIFDTTLTSSALTPGVRLRVPQKIKIAQALERLGVDALSTGFPGRSQEEQVAAREILAHTEKVGVGLSSRCSQGDIAAALTCLGSGQRVYLTLSHALDDETLEHKHQMTRSQALRKMLKSVEFALRYFPRVHVLIPDFDRVNAAFMLEVLYSLLDAGISSVILADPNGRLTPEVMYTQILQLYHRVPNLRQIHVGVECHNTLGLAVANSWAALRAGASQVNCSINGLGAGAGSCSLAPLVGIIESSKELAHHIEQPALLAVSELVARQTGIAIANHHPVTGAFAQMRQQSPLISGLFLGLHTQEGSRHAKHAKPNLAEPTELAIFLKERGHNLAPDKLQILSKKLERDQRCGMKISTEKVLRLLDQLAESERGVI